jgi:purine-binding chemotaxis protein CheW
MDQDQPSADASRETADSIVSFADSLEALQAQAAPKKAAEAEYHLVTFVLEKEEFGVPVRSVREIIRVSEITRVPQAPPHIRGVTNLRGRIIPVVEIRTRIGLTPATVGYLSRILLVEAHDRVFGLLVDAVTEVLKVPASSVTPAPPEVLSSASAEYFVGVAQLEKRLIVLLDLDRVVTGISK